MDFQWLKRFHNSLLTKTEFHILEENYKSSSNHKCLADDTLEGWQRNMVSFISDYYYYKTEATIQRVAIN